MATNRRDVQLVIKARDEATKAVGAITKALDQLHVAQTTVGADGGKTSSTLTQMVTALASVEQAFSKTASSVDQAEAALAKQRGSLSATEAQYTALKAQADAAAQSIVNLAVAQRAGDAGAAGKVAVAQAAYRDLNTQIERTGASVAQQRANLVASADTFGTIKNAALAAGAALNTFGDESARNALVAAESGQREAAAREAVIASYREQAAAARASIAAEAAQADINARLGVTLASTAKSARDSAAAFEEADRAERRLTAAADALRAQIDPLGASQARLNSELERARTLYRANKISADELAAAEKHLADEAGRAAAAINGANGRGAGGKPSFLGLKPYELTNLGYQVNDVVTQLASGTSITQTFAQQGGQILQLLPGLGARIIAILPALTAAVAVFGSLFAIFNRAGDNAEQIRKFDGALGATADSSRHTGEELLKTAKALDAYGLSTEDARTVTLAFVKDGLNPGAIVAFGRAAQNMADVLGIKVVDAAKQLGPAFTAGYDAIAKLDDATNFLTAAEREHIKAMFDSGNAAGARALAFKIFADQQDEAAKKARGPWSDAIKNLGTAFSNFLDILANSKVIQGTVEALSYLAKGARDLTAALSGNHSIDEYNDQIKRLDAQIAGRGDGSGGFVFLKLPGVDNDKNLKAAIADLVAKRAALVAARDKLLVAAATSGDPKDGDTEVVKKARDEVVAGLNVERQALGSITDQQKIRLAGESAYKTAIHATGDEVIANAQKQLAIQKEVDRQRKAVNYGALAGKITGIESGGNANAKNPRSTATGLGQFVEATFLKLFKTQFPTEASTRTDAEILSLRKDAGISTKLVELYARQNAKVLDKAGLAVNEASLYLAHFLGPNGAVKVLSASATTPIKNLLKGDAIKANPRILGGNATAGSVVGFARKKVGASDDDRAAIEVQSAVTNKLNDDIQKFNTTLDQRIQGWKDESSALAALADQEKLTIEAKYEAKKADEISKAVTQATNEATAANTSLSAERRAEIVRTVGALYDLKNAEALHNEVLANKRKAISDVIGLEQQRETAIRSLNDAYVSGESADNIQNIKQQIIDLTAQIEAALPVAREFAESLGDQRAVAALDNVQLKLKTTQAGLVSTQQVNKAFGDSIVSGINTFAQSVAAGDNVFKSLKNGFLNFAASFLQTIAQMIIQAIAFKYILTALGLPSLPSIGLNHSGGLAGGVSNRSREVSPVVFAGAMRYHSGGVAGLRPNEVPAILERNEEVLTTSDPRHRFNSGKGGGQAPAAPQSVKIINTIDPGEFVSQGASTTVGERAIMNVLRANANTLKSIVS